MHELFMGSQSNLRKNWIGLEPFIFMEFQVLEWFARFINRPNNYKINC